MAHTYTTLCAILRCYCKELKIAAGYRRAPFSSSAFMNIGIGVCIGGGGGGRGAIGLETYEYIMHFGTQIYGSPRAPMRPVRSREREWKIGGPRARVYIYYKDRYIADGNLCEKCDKQRFSADVCFKIADRMVFIVTVASTYINMFRRKKRFLECAGYVGWHDLTLCVYIYIGERSRVRGKKSV